MKSDVFMFLVKIFSIYSGGLSSGLNFDVTFLVGHNQEASGVCFKVESGFGDFLCLGIKI